MGMPDGWREHGKEHSCRRCTSLQRKGGKPVEAVANLMQYRCDTCRAVRWAVEWPAGWLCEIDPTTNSARYACEECA